MPRTKKESNTGFRNGDLFCFNCGASFEVKLPQPARFFVDIMKAFAKQHKNCAKTWQLPVVDQSWSELEKAMWWFNKKNGEHGESSLTMYRTLFGANIGTTISSRAKGGAHPCDPDDFRRCYLLLQTVPEWKQKLPLMKQVSPVWNNLVDHWDELTSMLEKAMATKDGKAPEMYELMKKLGC